MPTPSHATAEGTARFAARFKDAQANGFYRTVEGLTVSTLGLGSYLGAMDEATDRGYEASVVAALSGGINFIDTSLNYRHQRSERNIGEALAALMQHEGLARDEFVVCTKAGFLVPNALPELPPQSLEIVGNSHSMHPAFLEHQLGASRANLKLDTVDVFYLHNPESQLASVPADAFYERVTRAFAQCEAMVARGWTRFYGTATWSGFRKKAGEAGALDIERLVACAEAAGGKSHHLRFVQLPLNLGMCEALSNGFLLRVADLGLHAVASASLHQAQLAKGLPAGLAHVLPGPKTDAQRAIQFTRSAPGISVALTGMSRVEHVVENLGIASFPPATRAQFDRIFE
jgi:aryl-alcohol dehydrogenase-like predicted oxidoreductase